MSYPVVVEVEFQFTHPGRGATPEFSLYSCFAPRFNSRTPGGVRPSSDMRDYGKVWFQFTHPGRGATVSYAWGRADAKFQFTHPGRGATFQGIPQGFELEVSIHAPREGCDIHGAPRLDSDDQFQFTHPGRGATRWRGI